MAAHYVTCVYCGERFNRDKEPTTQVSARRYAHKECAEKHEANKSQEEKDLEALEKYIMHLFDEPYVNARVRKQLKEYKEQYNFTYSGILKTLIYWYEIKGNSTEDAHYFQHANVGAYDSFFYMSNIKRVDSLLTSWLIEKHMEMYQCDKDKSLANKRKALWGDEFYGLVEQLHQADKEAH